MSIQQIPNEALFEIFQHLEVEDLIQCTFVDRRFNAVAQDAITRNNFKQLSDVQENKCIRNRIQYYHPEFTYAKYDNPTLLEWKGIVSLFRGKEVFLKEGILKKVDRFLEKTKATKANEFRCFFPFSLPQDENIGVYIEIQPKDPPGRLKVKSKYCVFLRELPNREPIQDLDTGNFMGPGPIEYRINLILPFTKEEVTELKKTIREKVEKRVVALNEVYDRELAWERSILKKLAACFCCCFQRRQ